SVICQRAVKSANGRVRRAGGRRGMSWLPGTASTGGPRARRKAAARSCWPLRPRCVRSPLTMTSSGPTAATRSASARSTAGSSFVPTCKSERWRTRVGTADAGYRLASMTDESAEVFDDLYLGLRAGGAMRKQRRGESLTDEEQEAIGRWQRLSTWRKAVAIGGFALGTFGLGFTLGGLVFGRWRKAA